MVANLVYVNHTNIYIFMFLTKYVFRGNSRPKLHLTFGMLPSMIYLFQKFVLSKKQYKYAMNLAVAQTKGANR